MNYNDKEEMKFAYNEIADIYSLWQLEQINYKEYTENLLKLVFLYAERSIDNEFNNFRHDLSCKYQELKVLELGCSSGSIAMELAKLSCHTLGVDFSKKMIELAESTRDTYLLDGNKRIELEYLCADFCDDDFVEKVKNLGFDEFDIIIASLDTLNHIQPSRLAKLFSNIEKLSKKGTTFVLDILSEEYFYNVFTHPYVKNFGDQYLIWENELSEEPLVNHITITAFRKMDVEMSEGNGGELDKGARPLFAKSVCKMKEYFHEPSELEMVAMKTGFELEFLDYTVDSQAFELAEDYILEADELNESINDFNSFECDCDAETIRQYFVDNLPERFLLIFSKKASQSSLGDR